MSELKQRYQALRSVLTHLVNTQADRHASGQASIELRHARSYLRTHCAECGVRLTNAEDGSGQRREFVVASEAPAEITTAPLCLECNMWRCVVRQQLALA